jgi:hypothetical protein
MKASIVNLLMQALAAAVVPIGIFAYSFILTGRWPPQWLLIGTSLGSAASPAFWRMVDARRRRKAAARAEEDGP